MLAKSLRFNFRNKLPKNTLSFPSFNLRYEENDLGKLQVAVVVSKKVDKRATVRNKIKRQILELIRINTNAQLPVTLVFYIKKQAITSLNLEKEVIDAIKTACDRKYYV